MNKRYIGALFLAPFVIFLFLGGFWLKYGIMVLSLLGMYEFYKVIKNKGVHPIEIAGYALCIMYYLTLGTSMNFKLLSYVMILATLMLMCIPVVDVKYNFIDVGATLLGFIYVALFFSFIVLVDVKDSGNILVWLIFIGSWLCDTTAYYVGRAFGKTKLCPEVSPKKTIEGSIGGLLGSTVACGLFGMFVASKAVTAPSFHYFIIGALCGVFCQFGDLTASSIKRHVGEKDYSNLIPGHGGILDRFDSILFASVVVFYYLTFIMGI